jgi:hypothetical protein
MGRDAEGSALSCVNGLWVKFKFNEKIYSVVFESSSNGGGNVYKSLNLGQHLLCVFQEINLLIWQLNTLLFIVQATYGC